MSSPLPWVKSHTRVLTSLKWLAIPIAERGVFDHLCRLGGVGSKRGYVEGTDEQIALLIRCDTNLVTSTVERLAAKPYESLRRRRGGVLIVNWDQHQAPSNYDPDTAYGRKSTVRDAVRVTESTPLVRVEGEREGDREKRERVVAHLRSVRGWPADEDRDGEFAERLLADFADVDLAAEAMKFATWVLDHPFKANSSPRSRFRNWCVNARLFAARDASTKPQPLGGSVVEQLARIDAAARRPA